MLAARSALATAARRVCRARGRVLIAVVCAFGVAEAVPDRCFSVMRQWFADSLHCTICAPLRYVRPLCPCSMYESPSLHLRGLHLLALRWSSRCVCAQTLLSLTVPFRLSSAFAASQSRFHAPSCPAPPYLGCISCVVVARRSARARIRGCCR
jgi:hypothetical protein